MKCFKIQRKDNATYLEDEEMIVIVEDFAHAEKLARMCGNDFRNKDL